jgi:ABC-type transport system involved in multi-copper enzyme maturation permease subunit
MAAERFKLTHNKIIPILAAFAVVFAAAQVQGTSPQEGAIPGQLGVTTLAALSPFNCILLAAFPGFFVATEFDNGGARNSLALGKNRFHLYITKQTSVFVAFAVTLFVSSVAAAAMGTALFGFGDMGNAEFAGFFLTMFGLQLLYHLVYAALFTAIAFITRNPALTVLLSIGALIAEMVLVAFLGQFGGFAQTARTVLPTHSVMGLHSWRQGLLGHADPAFLARSVTASVLSIALLTAVGAWAFKKAEIK